jgi:hypothetical protein
VPKSVEVVVPVEVVVALEAVVSVEALVSESPTWVTAPEAAVAAPSPRLTGRVSREHDRQCDDRHKCHLSRTSQRLHGEYLTFSSLHAFKAVAHNGEVVVD